MNNILIIRRRIMLILIWLFSGGSVDIDTYVVFSGICIISITEFRFASVVIYYTEYVLD